MHLKALRSYLFLPFLLAAVTQMMAQPCADTQPSIAGSQVVSNNQPGVIYSTPSIPGHTYTWTVTGGSITSGQNTSQITVLWGAIGMGSVSVTETNPAAGCFSTDTKTVSVRPLLVSYFYYTNTSCYGDMLSFFDASVADITNPIVQWEWDFGDLTTSTLQNPTHQYLPPYNTTWTVTLIVTNQQGQKDTIYDAVYVNPNQFIPVAAFSFNNPPCAYQPITFDASASTTPPLTGIINHYDWTFGDPASGSNDTISGPGARIVNHIFSGPGTYNVQLIITNDRYCKDTLIQTISVAASVPTANYQYSTPTCQNNPVFFTNLSFFPPGYDIVTWTWNFGDGSGQVVINAPNPPDVSHIFPGLGPYNVSLMVTNNAGCMDTMFQAVSLVPSPLANFEWDVNCALDTVHFTNLSEDNMGPPIVTYSWDFGDPASGNNTSTLANPGHVYMTPGIYTIRLAIANTTGCPDTITKTITIYPKPAVEYTWNVGTQNNQIQFHVDSTITNLGAIGYMMVWNFGDGTYQIGNHNPTHTYMGAGSFDCILTVTDTLGCSNSVTHTVIVPSMPVAFYSSDGPVCLGETMCFTDLSSVPTPPFGWIQQWVWEWGDGSPNDTVYFPNNPNICHNFTAVGTYLVTLTVWDNWGFYDSYSHNQDVLPIPIANFFYSSACEGQVVNFTDASFPNGGGNIISWSWEFADPGSGVNDTSNLQNPSHIFTYGDSTYMVRLIIVNFNDCRDTVIKPVYVFPSPPVDFTHDTACATQVLTFNADTTITYIDSIATWSWNFGDGSPLNTSPVTVSHMYSLPGYYIVTLTVTDIHGCVNSISHGVTVNPLPIPLFTWSNPSCEGSPVQYTDQSYVPTGYVGYIAKWVWDFGDGTTQTIVIPGSPNVLHTFATPGQQHLVRLTVWTADSCSAFIEDTVTSTPTPFAGFEWSPIHCQGQLIQFNDLSQTNGGGAIVYWNWDFGDPSSGIDNGSALKNPVHTFDTAGIYSVRLIVKNVTGCVDTIIQPVVINQLPLANFAFDTACFGTPTQFTDLSVANATTIITYDWDFGDGSPHSPMQSPTHTYLTYGYFNVTLTITNSNGCTHDTTRQILVNPLPMAEFSFSTPNCVGAVVNFNDLSTTVTGYLGSIVKWEWDFDDGTTQTILFPGNPNVTHTFVGPALSHNVRLTVTTSDSCVAFVEHVVNSIPAPAADFSYSTSTCADQAVQFQDLSQPNGGGNIISWKWNFDDPASGVDNISYAEDPVHVFTTFGQFDVMLIVTNTSNCTDTIIHQVFVNMLPVANFTADSACLGVATNFTDISTPNALNIIAWDWNFGDGSLHSPLQNPTHTYGNYGYFNVTLTITNSNGCVKDTTMQIYVKPVPNAEFSFTTPNCVGAVVNYTDLSSTVPGFLGTIVKWTWDFDDGTFLVVNFPGNPNVSHTFVGPALSHNVRLTIQVSDSCTAYVEHIVNSIPSPAADFYYTGSSCVGSVVQFNDLSQTNGGGNIISWFWNFGDPASGGNNIDYSQNPMHIFTTPGIDTVMLIVKNTSNCTDTMWQAVTVDSLAQAAFVADTACLGSPTHFTDQSIAHAAGISSWTWDFGDGLPGSNQPSPSHTYNNYGLFNVTLTIVNTNGCSNSITHQVLVRPNPIAEFNYSTPNCLGAVVNFTNLSTTVPGYPGTIVQWLWDFGDGTTQTVNFPANPNVTHTFVGNATNHVVRLTVTTSTGCTAFIEHTVTSIPAPSAAFSYPAERCEDMAVQFTDQSQSNGGGNLISWLWNFGDPASGTYNISIAQNPIHYFTSSGNFIVSLIVTNSSGCTDTIVDTLGINVKPTADFHADTACLGSLTHFTDNSTATPNSIAGHLWDFGDGQTSTDANPTHLYGGSGVFQVKLTVTSNLGCENDITKGILVLPAPVAAFTVGTPNCAADSVHFIDQSVTPHGSIVQWEWNFNDGTTPVIILYPASPNINHYFTLGGTYQVVLTITTSDNCVADVTQSVTIEPAPLANFSYTSTLCEGLPVQFNDESQPNGGTPVASWHWDFDDPGSGGANTSPLENPTHTFTTNGQFHVKLTVTNANGCVDTISKPVNINQGPSAMFTSDTSCLNMPTTFTDQSTTPSGTIIAWLWNFGDPGSGTFNTSTLQNPTHTFSMTGNFNVTLTVTNSNNCTHDTVVTITVNPKPNAFFSADAACVGSPTQFNDLSTAPGSSIVAWFWDFGDGTGTSTDQNPIYTYTGSGTYNVKLRVTNLSNCQDSIIIPVVARPTPVAAYSYINFFCPAGQVNFQDESQGVGAAITEHLWIFEPGSTSDVPNPTHTFSATDTTFAVTLIVTDNYGCKDTIIDSVYVKPGMAFTFTNDTVCYLDPTHFHTVDLAAGDSLYSPYWEFGDPASGPQNHSYLYNPTHIFTQPGTYIVKLRVTNSDNCTDSTYLPVNVHALPEPAFEFISTPCDSVIHFQDLSYSGSGTISSWEWTFGDGQSVTINGPGSGDTSHLYSGIGTYNVILKVTNTNGCIDTVMHTVELYPCIMASFNHDTLLCARSPITFSDSSLPVTRITNWHWYFGDGQDTTYNSHAPVVRHSYADAGVYNVDLVINALVSGVAFTDTARQVLIIHPTPLTAFSNMPVCWKQVTIFKDTSDTFGEPINSWTWTFGENQVGDTSYVKNPTHQYDSAGYYLVKLITVNRFGCKDSLTKTTRVHNLPVADFAYEIACTDNPTDFQDMTEIADTALGAWMWNFGDPNTNVDTSLYQNPNYIYRSEGQYNIRMIVQDMAGCRDTVDSTITVHLSPISSFTFVENIDGMIGKLELDNHTIGADTYFWDFGNGQNSAEENPIVTYSEDGTYLIMLMSSNEFQCIDTTFMTYTVLFKGLYIPNAFAPSSTNLSVRNFKPVGVNLKTFHIEVFDAWGHLVWESNDLDSQGRPTGEWNGNLNGQPNSEPCPMGTYMWKASGTFIDDTIWEGSDIGKGSISTMGSVSLIR